MLIHIFGREDDAGIGPAGPRCGAGPWAANGESLESIGLSGNKLRPSSLVDRAGSGYAKYGTKQESIEGALEELDGHNQNTLTPLRFARVLYFHLKKKRGRNRGGNKRLAKERKPT